jgi:hypothetical protein
MADEISEWDLLSPTGSETNIYWPNTDVEGTNNEGASKVDEDKVKEDKIKSDTEDNDEGINAICDAIRDNRLEDNNVGSLKTEGLSSESVVNISISDVQDDSGPAPAIKLTEPNLASEISQAVPPTHNVIPTSSESICESNIVEKMTSVLESAISSVTQILMSPQFLLDMDFALNILDTLEKNCINLRNNAGPKPQLSESLTSLLSKTALCAHFVRSQTYNNFTMEQTQVTANKPKDTTLPFSARGASYIPSSQGRITEWQWQPQATRPNCLYPIQHMDTSRSSRPNSKRGYYATAQYLHEQYKEFNCMANCNCPSPKYRPHPSIFPDWSKHRGPSHRCRGP